eukprot:scaffold390_cov115-Isochrysis_galbana.AAC.2
MRSGKLISSPSPLDIVGLMLDAGKCPHRKKKSLVEKRYRRRAFRQGVFTHCSRQSSLHTPPRRGEASATNGARFAGAKGAAIWTLE